MTSPEALPTEDEVLEQPGKTEATRGLVPRAGLFIAIGIFILMLLGFAFYDLVIRKPSVQPMKPQKSAEKMAVDRGIPIAPGADIAAIANKQERTAPSPAPDGPLPSSSTPAMSPMTSPPPGVSTDRSPTQRNGEKNNATSQEDKGGPQTASAIFAISGEGDGARGPISAATKGLANDATDKMIQSLEAKLLNPASAGSADAEMLKAALSAQGQNRSGKDQQWLKENESNQSSEVTFASQPASKWLVFQGTRVPVVVREAVNSDLPGPITAMVTAPVFDSINQCGILIPVGTRLIGSYSANIRPGQNRVLLGFNRLIFPDGRSLNLNGAQGVDQIGAAGMEGEVDNHWLKRFGYSFALALLSTRMDNSGPSSITVSQGGATSTTTVAGQVLGQVGQSILANNANIPPTITMEVGSRLFVTMVRDLALQPVSTTRCP